MAPTDFSDDDYHLDERFDLLLAISGDSLVTLATTVHDIKPSPTGRVLTRHTGSCNVVFIEFSDGIRYVIRIPATGWGCRFTETAKCSLRSQVFTMQFIRKKTTIPVPNVYAFSSEMSNVIGALYIIISFISGCRVSKMWFDKPGPTILEERRRSALDTIAEAMSQLSRLDFDKIGSLQFNNDELEQLEIGPCYGTAGLDTFGPFTSSQQYLWTLFGRSDKINKELGVGAQKTIEWMIPYLRVTFLSCE